MNHKAIRFCCYYYWELIIQHLFFSSSQNTSLCLCESACQFNVCQFRSNGGKINKASSNRYNKPLVFQHHHCCFICVILHTWDRWIMWYFSSPAFSLEFHASWCLVTDYNQFFCLCSLWFLSRRFAKSGKELGLLPF